MPSFQTVEKAVLPQAEENKEWRSELKEKQLIKR